MNASYYYQVNNAHAPNYLVEAALKKHSTPSDSSVTSVYVEGVNIYCHSIREFG